MPALKQDEYQTYVHNGNFGHIMITFWAFPYGLDNKIVIQSGVNCVQNVPKFWIHFGHFHAMGTYFEHLAGIVQTTVKSLDTFWA